MAEQIAGKNPASLLHQATEGPLETGGRGQSMRYDRCLGKVKKDAFSFFAQPLRSVMTSRN